MNRRRFIKAATSGLVVPSAFGQIIPGPGIIGAAGSQGVVSGGGGGGPLTQVQKKSYGSTAAATSHNITLDSTPTQNNLLILGVVSDATVTTPSGWSLAVSSVANTGTYIYYKVAGASESATITVSPTSSAQTCIGALEYSGNATSSPLDKTASATGSDSTVESGTTATTAQADELLIAIGGLSSPGSRNFSSWSNSFTEELEVGATGSGILVRIAMASRIVSAIGTYSTVGSITSASSNWSGAIATFKKA